MCITTCLCRISCDDHYCYGNRKYCQLLHLYTSFYLPVLWLFFLAWLNEYMPRRGISLKGCLLKEFAHWIAIYIGLTFSLPSISSFLLKTVEQFYMQQSQPVAEVIVSFPWEPKPSFIFSFCWRTSTQHVFIIYYCRSIRCSTCIRDPCDGCNRHKRAFILSRTWWDKIANKKLTLLSLMCFSP